jgi:hypothetical protein
VILYHVVHKIIEDFPMIRSSTGLKLVAAKRHAFLSLAHFAKPPELRRRVLGHSKFCQKSLVIARRFA